MCTIVWAQSCMGTNVFGHSRVVSVPTYCCSTAIPLSCDGSSHFLVTPELAVASNIGTQSETAFIKGIDGFFNPPKDKNRCTQHFVHQ